MRCADCTFFEPDIDRVPYGHCGRWLHGYLDAMDELTVDMALVEDDEGWGNIVGPEFGCILFEERK